jgi:cysteine desulfurase
VLAAFGRVAVEPTAHDALWAHPAPRRRAPRTVFAMGLANSETGVVAAGAGTF